MKRSSSEMQQQKKHMTEQLWLNYFNQALFSKGLITETERNRLKNKIDSRTHPPTKTKDPC